MESIKCVVKWSGKEYKIEMSETETVKDLKNTIQKLTGVKPKRQKLLNLRIKGKIPEDKCVLRDLILKPGFKIMMMGSLEEDIVNVNTAPENLPDIINDLDVEDEEVAIEHQEIYLSKIQKRIENYNVTILNKFRPGKKLLVLDVDYTLFDHKSSADTAAELMRPFLHEFLTSAYENYDIAIWSATGMKWIEEKMRMLGVSSNPNYKIAFYLDSYAMISVYTTKYGNLDVKPLGVIWGKFKEFGPKNTIMFDDIRRNFIMNPKNGLKIKPFRQAHFNRDKDNELLKLSQYLKDLAEYCDDFSSINHRYWEIYSPIGQFD